MEAGVAAAAAAAAAAEAAIADELATALSSWVLEGKSSDDLRVASRACKL